MKNLLFLQTPKVQAFAQGSPKMIKTILFVHEELQKQDFFTLCLNDDHTIPELSFGNLLFVTKSGGLRVHNNLCFPDEYL